MPKNKRSYDRCEDCTWSRRVKEHKYICIQKKSPFCTQLVDEDHWCECHERWIKVAYMQRLKGWTFEQCVEFITQCIKEDRKSEMKDQGDI